MTLEQTPDSEHPTPVREYNGPDSESFIETIAACIHAFEAYRI